MRSHYELTALLFCIICAWKSGNSLTTNSTWTSWINNSKPGKYAELELLDRAEVCDGYAPVDIRCSIAQADDYCSSDSCQRIQQTICSVNIGFKCETKLSRKRCRCCDHKVQYRCPAKVAPDMNITTTAASVGFFPWLFGGMFKGATHGDATTTQNPSKNPTADVHNIHTRYRHHHQQNIPLGSAYDAIQWSTSDKDQNNEKREAEYSAGIRYPNDDDTDYNDQQRQHQRMSYQANGPLESYDSQESDDESRDDPVTDDVRTLKKYAIADGSRPVIPRISYRSVDTEQMERGGVHEGADGGVHGGADGGVHGGADDSHWSSWYNKHQPTVKGERELLAYLTPDEMPCGHVSPALAECAVVSNRSCDMSRCRHYITCTATTGLICINGRQPGTSRRDKQPTFYRGYRGTDRAEHVARVEHGRDQCTCCDFKIRYKCPDAVEAYRQRS